MKKKVFLAALFMFLAVGTCTQGNSIAARNLYSRGTCQGYLPSEYQVR